MLCQPCAPTSVAGATAAAETAVARTPRYNAVLADMERGKTVLLDGPISTELDSRGLKMSEGRENMAAINEPDALIQLHKDYIAAGSRVITAHTFSRFKAHTGAELFEPLNRCAVECAVEARRQAGLEDSVLVAGSVAYHSYSPVTGNMNPDQPVDVWERELMEMVAIHKAAGADLLLLEMMGGPEYTAAAIRAAQAQRIPFWLGFSAYSGRAETGRRGDGMLRVMDNHPHTPLKEALPDLIRLATKGPDGNSQDTGCDLIGAMHTKPRDIEGVLSAVQEHWDGPLLCYPDDVGADPETAEEILSNGDSLGGMKTEQYVNHCLGWHRAFPRCRLLGACCGFNPSHIAALTAGLAAAAPGGGAL